MRQRKSWPLCEEYYTHFVTLYEDDLSSFLSMFINILWFFLLEKIGDMQRKKSYVKNWYDMILIFLFSQKEKVGIAWGFKPNSTELWEITLINKVPNCL